MTHRRIVMLGTAFDTMGGISSVVNVYRAAGLFERWPVTYIATHRDGSKFAKLNRAGCAVMQFLRLLILRRVLAVHVHTSSRASFWRKGIFFLLAGAFRVPIILHLHGGNFDQYFDKVGSYRKRIIRFAFNHVAAVIALSDEWRKWMLSRFGKVNVFVAFNPVAIPAPVTDEREAATLLFLGQFGQRKGIYILLAAVAKLAGEFPTLRLLAGGDGELEQVREMANALGIKDRVEILGWVKGAAKDALLARSTIYVLPSYAENLPMSVLEAMAAGMPVISTPVGGIPSAIEHGVEGYLVTPGDSDALAEAIRGLLVDRDACRQMGEAARAKAIVKFSAEKVIADVEHVYRALGLFPS